MDSEGFKETLGDSEGLEETLGAAETLGASVCEAPKGSLAMHIKARSAAADLVERFIMFKELQELNGAEVLCESSFERQPNHKLVKTQTNAVPLSFAQEKVKRWLRTVKWTKHL